MGRNNLFWGRLPASALGGGIVWLALVVSRIAGLTHLTLIDCLFLLAPLVGGTFDPLRKCHVLRAKRYFGMPARIKPCSRLVQMLSGINGNRARNLETASCGSMSSTFFIMSAA